MNRLTTQYMIFTTSAEYSTSNMPSPYTTINTASHLLPLDREDIMLNSHQSIESYTSKKSASVAKYGRKLALALSFMRIGYVVFVMSLILSMFILEQGHAYAQNRVLPPIPITPRAMPTISPKVRKVINKRDQALKRSEALKKLKERRKSEDQKQKQRDQEKKRLENKKKANQGAIAAPKGGAANGGKEKNQVISETGKAPEDNLSEDFIKKCGYVKPKKNARFHLDIVDEELESVVKLIACIKMRNIILSKPLKGKKITIYSPVKVSADEAYRAFLTALEANGLTISRQGKFWRIIEIKDFARSSDPFQKSDSTPPREDRMVTQIVQLKHVDAQEINESDHLPLAEYHSSLNRIF